MAKTRHIQARMSQRGITQNLMDLTLRYGVRHHDGKVILNRDGLRALQRELGEISRTAQKAMSKGGLVVIEENGTLITTYNLDSFDRSQAS